MSLKIGNQTLLDIAKESAVKQIQKANASIQYVLLTNDKPLSLYPISADKILKEIYAIDVSPNYKTVHQIIAIAQTIRLSDFQSQSLANSENKADLYYYSDFKKSTFDEIPENKALAGLTIFNIPIQTAEIKDFYIDTAFLTTPVLQQGKDNKLVVKSVAQGESAKESPILSLKINGQLKSATSINFSGRKENIDTFTFSVNSVDWQQIELSLNDASVKFDDTFRLTARCSPNLSVLVLNEEQPNPFIQAAFKAFNGFKLTQSALSGAPANWKDYNLVLLNGITYIDATLGNEINDALQNGASICIFPGKTYNFQHINEGLSKFGEISIGGLDSNIQNISSIQQGSNLVRDLFDKLPENVQLPVSNWHYKIIAGLSANQQSILSFRNGDPFLARYTPSKGQLFFCASSADLQSGNFAGSYFFTPFLYQMTVQSASGSVYALTSGKKQPVFFPLNDATERNKVHVSGMGIDAIPPQHSAGAGVDVYIDDIIHQPAFYNLYAQKSDTVKVAFNISNEEKKLIFWNINELKNNWKGTNVYWQNYGDNLIQLDKGIFQNIPIWKITISIALLLLFLETLVILNSKMIPSNKNI